MATILQPYESDPIAHGLKMGEQTAGLLSKLHTEHLQNVAQHLQNQYAPQQAELGARLKEARIAHLLQPQQRAPKILKTTSGFMSYDPQSGQVEPIKGASGQTLRPKDAPILGNIGYRMDSSGMPVPVNMGGGSDQVEDSTSAMMPQSSQSSMGSQPSGSPLPAPTPSQASQHQEAIDSVHDNSFDIPPPYNTQARQDPLRIAQHNVEQASQGNLGRAFISPFTPKSRYSMGGATYKMGNKHYSIPTKSTAGKFQTQIAAEKAASGLFGQIAKYRTPYAGLVNLPKKLKGSLAMYEGLKGPDAKKFEDYLSADTLATTTAESLLPALNLHGAARNRQALEHTLKQHWYDTSGSMMKRLARSAASVAVRSHQYKQFLAGNIPLDSSGDIDMDKVQDRVYHKIYKKLKSFSKGPSQYKLEPYMKAPGMKIISNKLGESMYHVQKSIDETAKAHNKSPNEIAHALLNKYLSSQERSHYQRGDI